MKQLLFIRHGATAGNLERRYIGRTDEPLCEAGVAQIKALRSQKWNPDKLFVSPMLRTKQTAELLFPDVPQTTVNDFREMDFGIFEGKTTEELARVPEYQTWVDGLCLGPIPMGESTADFKARCRRAFSEIITTVPDGFTAAFSIHGGVIMAILEYFAHPQRGFYEYHIGNGSYLWCTYEEGVLSVQSPF